MRLRNTGNGNITIGYTTLKPGESADFEDPTGTLRAMLAGFDVAEEGPDAALDAALTRAMTELRRQCDEVWDHAGNGMNVTIDGSDINMREVIRAALGDRR